MKVAILGATSQLAKDLVLSFANNSSHELVLFARRPDYVSHWMANLGLGRIFIIKDFSCFNADEQFDAVLNFVGAGDPAKVALLGGAIFDLTLKYDELALDYISKHPECRYIFLSSGAVYGASFDAPVNGNTKSSFAINDLLPQDWYAIAKLHAECRHRALPHLPIVDIRIFNYFSHTQDLKTRFFITDVVRSIIDKRVFQTSADNLVRDFIGPEDFYSIVMGILNSNAINIAIDCYSKEPIDKLSLLAALEVNFKLKYELTGSSNVVNATGIKSNYYSVNKLAEIFNYKPSFTSLMNINKQLSMLLAN